MVRSVDPRAADDFEVLDNCQGTEYVSSLRHIPDALPRYHVALELEKLLAEGNPTMAKQALAQIAQVTDPSELEQGLAQMQAMKTQAPPEFQPAIELIIKRATERIEELRAAAGEEE